MVWALLHNTSQELGLSVEEALSEAMNTTMTASDAPHVSMPQPHLPLRKASAQHLHHRRTGPRPLQAVSTNHQLRGFHPTTVHPVPQLDHVTASSEHAFAERDVKRSSKLPLDVHALGFSIDTLPADAEWPLVNDRSSASSRPPSSALSSPAISPTKSHGLRPSKSVGDGLRKRHFTPRRSTPLEGILDIDTQPSQPPHLPERQRESVLSGLTSSSSLANHSSLLTDRSSQATGNSSPSGFVIVHPDSDFEDGKMSVEDAIGMYEDGFDSARPSIEIATGVVEPERPLSSPAIKHEKNLRPNVLHRRSRSATVLVNWNHSTPSTLGNTTKPPSDKRIDSKLTVAEGIPRDRYGFKKASHHISVEHYDMWNLQYSNYLERRSKKWHTLMRSYGLSTDNPLRFPPKGEKIKRYVRKGIPPNLRGAAWFWYAGGPGQLAKDPGLYPRILSLVGEGQLSEADREHIERDLNRTFPDNIKFKPDSGFNETPPSSKRGRHSVEPETPMVCSLRRVLQAFAIHNPHIGYCQSLNFIAGLLLLFLDEDEAKAFTLLNIVTSTHLPGTHGVALEGANIDIAVLMSCIKNCLPNIWVKLDDKGGVTTGDVSAQALRLPTVSLATTAWFMSLFVGTLPIESVLRVWDCLFFEGSKTLFRIALAIFKAGEKQIMAVSDPMEIFQVVQTIPRSMLDINGLMEVCFRRRGGFGHISQGLIEERRNDRREAVRDGVADITQQERTGWAKRWRSKTKA